MPEKQTILFVTHDKLWVGGEDPAYGWNKSNLEEILLEIKSRLKGKSVRVLLDDNLTYLVNIAISPKNKLHRFEIIEKVQEQVPQTVESGFWDYKIDKDGNVERIIAFVVHRDFLTDFAEGLISADIQVEASEPVSIALARLTSHEEKPVIIAYVHESHGNISLILSEKGNVICSIGVENDIDTNKISKFIEFCQERYNVTPSKILLSGEIDLTEESFGDIPIGHVDLNPFKGIAIKKDIKGPDEKVLNLDSEKLLKPIVMPPDTQEEPQVPKRRKLKIKYLIPVVVLAILFLIGSIVTKQASEPTPTPQPTPEVVVPTPEPEADLNSLKFNILNGSGVAGEATYVEGLLGITAIKKGNAQNYDYEQTEVSLKQNLPGNVYNTVVTKLQSEYDLTLSEQALTEESEFDVVVVVGKKK